jgi:hypothetical protein
MQKGNEKEQMFLVIEGGKRSGQSQQAYCKEQGIRYHVFHYWYKLYRDEQQATTKPAATFIELQVQQEATIPAITTSITTTATNVELLLPDGKRLLFHSSVEACFLRSLL